MFRRISSPMIALIALPLLAGCFPRPDYQTLPDTSVIRLQAKSANVAVVNFATPSAAERQQVQQILATLPPAGIRVRVRLPDGVPPPSAASFRNSIDALGLEQGLATLDSLSSGQPETVLVIYQITAKGPNCKTMVTPSEAVGSARRPTVAFGCATNNNLANMVADPADLASGRAYDGPDGQDTDAAISRYHDDKVKALRGTTSTSGLKSN